jgi:hypothetical protein
MKNFKKLIGAAVLCSIFLSSCTLMTKSMREPNNRVNFVKDDFTFSGQLSAEASSTKIFGIDFERLFTKKTGSVSGGGSSAISLASIPVIGGFVGGDKTSGYALYKLMTDNAGYDIVFYPSFATTVKRPIIIPIFTITTVKVTAKLAKFK